MGKISRLVLAVSSCAAGVAATVFTQKKFKDPTVQRSLSDAADRSIHKIAAKVSDILPSEKFPSVLDADDRFFIEGQSRLLSSPPPGAEWRLGYSACSIIPGDINSRDYYLGGYLAYPPNKAESVTDDLKVRAITLDDGSGRGAVAFAVVDCVGLSNRDILDVRSCLKDLIDSGALSGVNVSSTHCHSGIDTQGIWGDLKNGMLRNPIKILLKDKDAVISGRDPIFMQDLKAKIARVIREALESAVPGNLAVAVTDGAEFSRAKRPPYVTDPRMISLRFDPRDGSRPTCAILFAAHPTNMGYSNRSLSGDFPYYLCDELDKKGFNGLYFQGTELAIAADRWKFAPEGSDNLTQIECYGRAIADKVLSGTVNYEPVEPLMNFRAVRRAIPVENAVFTALRKAGIIDNDVVDAGDGELRFITELGIVRLGSLTLLLIPGEMSPELLVGGALSSTDSYNHTSWDKRPLKDLFDGTVAGIGLCNDAIGYIIPDNDYGSFVAKDHYEESVSAGSNTASEIVGGFEQLASVFKNESEDSRRFDMAREQRESQLNDQN